MDVTTATYTGSDPESEIDVLYVDDDRDMTDLVPELLERKNDSLKVDSVNSPEEAIEALQKTDYRAIISDYNMPEMNGLELLEEIKKDHDIPFILYTGNKSKELGLRAIETGAQDYFWKDQGLEQYGHMADAIETYVEEFG